MINIQELKNIYKGIDNIINNYQNINDIINKSTRKFHFKDRYNINLNPPSKNKNKTFCIYAFKFPDNKLYIGQSIQPRNRILDYGQNKYQKFRSYTKIVQHIKKYSGDCIIYIIEFPDLKDRKILNIIEEYLIYITKAELNMELHPTSPRVPPYSYKPQKQPKKPYSWSPLAKSNISGDKNHFYGAVHTPEAIEKIRMKAFQRKPTRKSSVVIIWEGNIKPKLVKVYSSKRSVARNTPIKYTVIQREPTFKTYNNITYHMIFINDILLKSKFEEKIFEIPNHINTRTEVYDYIKNKLTIDLSILVYVIIITLLYYILFKLFS